MTIDNTMLAHFDAKGNSDKEIEESGRRLTLLPYLERALERPAEIWEDPDGTRKYLAAGLMEGKKKDGERKEGKLAIIAITLSRDKNNTKINTFYPGQEMSNLRAKRNGKLLYPSKK